MLYFACDILTWNQGYWGFLDIRCHFWGTVSGAINVKVIFTCYNEEVAILSFAFCVP